SAVPGTSGPHICVSNVTDLDVTGFCSRERGEGAVSYSDWFRRLTSQGGPGRKRARRSLLFTGIAAALVVTAGAGVLVAKPGQAPLKTTSVASSHQETGQSKTARKHTVPPAPALTITSVVP